MPTKKKTKTKKPQTRYEVLKDILKVRDRDVTTLQSRLKCRDDRNCQLVEQVQQMKKEARVLDEAFIDIQRRSLALTQEKRGLEEQLEEAKVVLAGNKAVHITHEEGEVSVRFVDDPYVLAPPCPPPSWKDAPRMFRDLATGGPVSTSKLKEAFQKQS